jgi:beta-lactamase class A
MQNYTMLDKQFKSFEQYCEGILGVSAVHIESGNEISFNSDQLFLMCSTAKVAIAIYLLQISEENEIDLREQYSVRDVDLRPGFAFTINDFDCHTGFPISWRNLLMLMLRESCNTSTDIILRKLGGPSAISAYLQKVGIQNMTLDRYTIEAIADTEGVKNLPSNLECTLDQYKALSATVTPEELATAKKLFHDDSRDHATPSAMTTLLLKLFKNELLNEQNTSWLLNTMRRNKLYPNRLMGLLPHRTPVAHKTGTATGYTNDVGIITLPHNAGHIAITAFIKESRKDKIPNERVLAEVSRTVYDFFLFSQLSKELA